MLSAFNGHFLLEENINTERQNQLTEGTDVITTVCEQQHP